MAGKQFYKVNIFNTVAFFAKALNAMANNRHYNENCRSNFTHKYMHIQDYVRSLIMQKKVFINQQLFIFQSPLLLES